jgi:hypothetical protein
VAEFRDDLHRVTAADVREVARAVNDSALLMLPRGIGRPPVGFEQAPQLSRFSVVGKTLPLQGRRHGLPRARRGRRAH